MGTPAFQRSSARRSASLSVTTQSAMRIMVRAKGPPRTGLRPWATSGIPAQRAASSVGTW